MTLLFGVAVTFIAGLVQGCGGFGLGMTAVPCLMLFYPPIVVVPAVLTLSLVNSSIVTAHARKHLSARLVAPLIIGGICGTPAGNWIITVLDPGLLKAGVGVLVVVVATLLLCGFSRPLKNPRIALVPVGVCSGVLNACTGMGGPPIILFLANQDMPKERFRASLICYFFFVSIFSILLYALAGQYTVQVAKLTAGFLLPMLAGTATGVWLSHHVPEALFRTIALCAVAFMGMTLLVSSVRSLF